jgi:hypothetical protein
VATNCVSVHRIYIALEPSLDGKEPTAFKAVVLSWSEFRRRCFGSEVGYGTVLGILRHRYVDEKQHADRFIQHAQKLHYPQFREALLRIASEELKHAGLIGEKIKELGGWLPAVLKTPPDEKKIVGAVYSRTWRKSGAARRNLKKRRYLSNPVTPALSSYCTESKKRSAGIVTKCARC